MRSIIPICLLLLLAGCVKQAGQVDGAPASQQRASVEDAARAIRGWQAQRNPEAQLVRLEVVTIDAQTGWFAALYDWQEGWWGGVCFLRASGQRLDFFELTEPTEQSMHTIRTVNLRGFPLPVVEVLGKTHMGNGSLYLYELHEEKPRLLLDTCAVDFHQDLDVLSNGVLERAYCDINVDGFDDLLLTGVAQVSPREYEVDEDGQEYCVARPTYNESVRKAFAFSPASRTFRELSALRLGPPRYHD